MNIAERARRIRYAGRWMVLLPLSAFTLFLAVAGILTFFHFDILARGFAIGNVALLPVIPGAFLWLAGWLLEGFSKSTH